MSEPTPAQPECFECWKKRNKGARIPSRVSDKHISEQRCCHCGKLTVDGIFVRYDSIIGDCQFPRVKHEKPA